MGGICKPVTMSVGREKRELLKLSQECQFVK